MFMLARICIVLVAVAATRIAGAEPGGEQARTPISTTDIASSRASTVVTLRTPGGVGSGVIVDPSGVIVTSLHVIRGETKVSVTLANGDVYDDVAVVEVDARRDIAVLKIKAFGLPSAPIGDSDQMRVGDRVVLVASPRGLSSSVSEGIVSALRDSGDGYRLVQTTAAASPGSSGGGMFDASGALVGILVSKLMNGENINFAVPSNYVRGLVGTEARMSIGDLASRFPAEESQPPRASANSVKASGLLRLAEILKESGLSYTEADEDSWTVTLRGDHNDTITVHISLYDKLVLSQAVVSDAAGLSIDAAQSLLELSYQANYAKLSIADGSVIALNESALRTTDGSLLGSVVKAVALLADDAAEVLGAGAGTGPALESAEPLWSESQRPAASSSIARLELLRGSIVLEYDKGDWTEQTVEQEAGANIQQFSHRDGDVHLRVISERSMVPEDRMEQIALERGRSSAPDLRVLRRGSRTVNGVRVRFLEYSASVDGVAVFFYSHFYSYSSGSLQLIGFSTLNIADSARPTIEGMVRGLTIGPAQ